MNIFPNIDLNAIAPVITLAAIAVFVGLVLLLRALLHSRIVVPVAIVVGVVVAGPALGGTLAAIVNTLAIVAIICSIAAVGALLIVRSHPDLRDMVREALSLLPRRTPSAALPSPIRRGAGGEVVDQPTAVTRHVTRHNSGSDWGF